MIAAGWPASRRLGPRGPLVFGIVNVTPDSFSDGGWFDTAAAAADHARRLWAEGADVLDLGGESTRPGAEPVSVEEERARVVPAIRAVREALPDAVISVDTRRASVAEVALAAGATVVNDVSGGADPGMAACVARAGAGWVLMHLRGTPQTMQRNTAYDDLVGEIIASLQGAVAAAEGSGIARSRLMVDPGVGFGKALQDNPRLIAATGRIAAQTGCPVMVGASRKRFIGELTGVAVAAERAAGSVGAACAAVRAGAAALRVHDVGATIQALQVYLACHD